MKILSFDQFLLESFSGFSNQGKSPQKIMEIQKKLVDLKFLEPKFQGNKDSIDGMFGDFSRDALARYQTSKGLSVKDGTITDETLKSLEIEPEKEIASYKSVPSGKINPSQSLFGYGKFTPASSKDAPLVVVFGGIPVAGMQSGDYMKNYFKDTGNKYNLFIANNDKVNGPEAYQSLLNKIEKDGINPSKKILYLFSGGMLPGMYALQKFGANSFDEIYLVDIWMKQDVFSKFFTDLAKENKDKVKYYYTSYGANNPSARNTIASLASTAVKNSSDSHMDTNFDAIKDLEKTA